MIILNNHSPMPTSTQSIYNPNNNYFLDSSTSSEVLKILLKCKDHLYQFGKEELLMLMVMALRIMSNSIMISLMSFTSLLSWELLKMCTILHMENFPVINNTNMKLNKLIQLVIRVTLFQSHGIWKNEWKAIDDNSIL